ncbi:MAG: hypothetical protein FJZ01_08470 [Candidatus Sericytochromatia bacterium]|nr:hypothetical protein [Candidatus Tanganyikabacteria bacterium]
MRSFFAKTPALGVQMAWREVQRAEANLLHWVQRQNQRKIISAHMELTAAKEDLAAAEQVLRWSGGGRLFGIR